MMMMHYGHAAPFMFMHLLGTIFWVALFALLVWTLINWLSRKNNTFVAFPPGTPPPPHAPLSAMEILRQRYARGEIDDQTFQNMRERLEATIPHQS